MRLAKAGGGQAGTYPLSKTYAPVTGSKTKGRLTLTAQGGRKTAEENCGCT